MPKIRQRAPLLSAISIATVSYTHLDVYKRQGQVPAEVDVLIDAVRKEHVVLEYHAELLVELLQGCLLYTSRGDVPTPVGPDAAEMDHRPFGTP